MISDIHIVLETKYTHRANQSTVKHNRHKLPPMVSWSYSFSFITVMIKYATTSHYYAADTKHRSNRKKTNHYAANVKVGA